MPAREIVNILGLDGSDEDVRPTMYARLQRDKE